MPRPKGVTAIAILMFVVAGFTALSGLVVGIAGIPPEEMPPELQELPIGADVVARIAAVVLLVLALLNAGLGLGLWFRKNWVRITVVVLGSIEVFFTVIQVLFLASRAQDLELVLGLIKLIVITFIIWYLVQPDVKKAFAPPPPDSPPTTEAPPANPSGEP